MISEIYMICNAYESGVGHGFQDDKLPNPYLNMKHMIMEFLKDQNKDLKWII